MIYTKYELPYPPTINTYYRNVNGKMLISKKGRDYRRCVYLQLLPYKKSKHLGFYRVKIAAYPPDRRRRDLDNILKALLDAMERAGIWENDYQISDLSIRRFPFDPKRKNKVNVWVQEL